MIRGGKLLKTGINKTKAGCLGDPIYAYRQWHSELDALHNLPKDQVKGAILYVAGWTKGGRIALSKPCRHCQQYLKKFPLKAIVYSLPDGSYEKMII